MSALLTELMVPFGYDYMLKAMWVSALVGAVCAFLSALTRFSCSHANMQTSVQNVPAGTLIISWAGK